MTLADELLTLSSAADADAALQKLQQRDIRQLPVLEDGRVAGLLRHRDILKWLQLQGAGKKRRPLTNRAPQAACAQPKMSTV